MNLKDVMRILKANSTLTDMLVDGADSIYHLKSPDAGSYPIIVVSVVTDNTILRYDNAEEHKRQTLRIHIITKDGRYEDIAEELINTLIIYPELTRKSTQEFTELNEFIKMIDFIMID